MLTAHQQRHVDLLIAQVGRTASEFSFVRGWGTLADKSSLNEKEQSYLKAVVELQEYIKELVNGSKE